MIVVTIYLLELILWFHLIELVILTNRAVCVNAIALIPLSEFDCTHS